MGHRVNRTRATQEFEAEENPYAMSTPSSSADVASSSGFFDGHPLAILADSGTNIMARVLGLVPDEQSSKILIQFYVSFPTSSGYHGLRLLLIRFRSLRDWNGTLRCDRSWAFVAGTVVLLSVI